METNNSCMLKQGARFEAKDKLGNQNIYRFDGIDLADLKDGIGCHYIILFNETRSQKTCVEAAWFCEALTDRKITVLGEEV